jgi:hypothetical protein
LSNRCPAPRHAGGVGVRPRAPRRLRGCGAMSAVAAVMRATASGVLRISGSDHRAIWARITEQGPGKIVTVHGARCASCCASRLRRGNGPAANSGSPSRA